MPDRSCKHINQPVRFMGLSGGQFVALCLIPLPFMRINLILFGLVLIGEFFLWKWYFYMHNGGKDKLLGNIDYNPIATMQVKSRSPKLIQDNSNFYDQLINTDEGSE